MPCGFSRHDAACRQRSGGDFPEKTAERQQYDHSRTVYLKAHLEPVNDLVMNIELLLAVQALSRITGLDMTAAEKSDQALNRYWY